MRASILFAASALFTLATAAAAQTAAPPPRMTPTQAMQLVERAGFKVVGGHVENRCGHVVDPRMEFGDLNGDGKAEVHVADVDPGCYAAPGAYYAILTRDASGDWHLVIAEDAIVGFEHSRTDGWSDLDVKQGDGACPGIRRYQSNHYVTPCGGGGTASQVASNAGGSPAPHGGGYPTDGWKMPVKFTALSSTQQAAIMHAAGMKLVGGVWKGCDGTSQVDPKDGVEIKDLNGDGRPEVIVSKGGYQCYGNASQGFSILRAVPGGWDQMTGGTGMPMFLKTHGVDGYPDIMVGGPGICFPVVRWNGREYASLGFFSGGELDKPC